MIKSLLLSALLMVKDPDWIPNGCLVNAVEFQGAVEAQHKLGPYTWTRIVGVYYWTNWHTVGGHAMCVFTLRNGDVWIYDIIHGSRKLGIRKKDLSSIATAIHRKDKHILGARFLD